MEELEWLLGNQLEGCCKNPGGRRWKLGLGLSETETEGNHQVYL